MRYRKVSTAFWNDEKVRTFDDDGRLAFLYLLTTPTMTSVGAMRSTLAGLAAELGWPPRRLEKALARAIEHGMVEVNAAAAWIALPKFQRHNAPESPNVAKAWAAAIGTLPECSERQALIERCRHYLGTSKAFLQAFEEGLAKAFPQGFTEPLAKGSPNQEQEQEQEQKQEGSPLPPFRPSTTSQPNGAHSRLHPDQDWGRAPR